MKDILEQLEKVEKDEEKAGKLFDSLFFEEMKKLKEANEKFKYVRPVDLSNLAKDSEISKFSSEFKNTFTQL